MTIGGRSAAVTEDAKSAPLSTVAATDAKPKDLMVAGYLLSGLEVDNDAICGVVLTNKFKS